jgi:uncharacterized protein
MQLQAIAALLRETPGVDQLILFGSYARGNWVEDRMTGYFSDYDLLVVVSDPALASQIATWAQLETQARALTRDITVTLIVHDIRELNQQIRQGRYFFADIVKEGIVLYDSKRVTLATPKALTREERLQMTQDYYDYWFASATQFWRGVGYFMRDGDLRAAAFLLHQSAERYLHTFTLVFTAYKHRTHDLEKLANLVESMHPAIRGALPRTSAEEQKLFTLLKRAYVDARYSASYRITAEELTTLREQVRDLAARVRQACAQELASLCGADKVRALAEPPQVNADLGPIPPAPPDLTDTQAVERWKDQLLASAHETGRQQGLQEGVRRARAGAIADVLSWRGVVLSDEERARVLRVEDEATLERLWQRARFAHSAAELFAEDEQTS